MAPAPAPDPSLARFAARAMLARLDAMAACADGVRRAEDVEDVHRMRVASRRLRAALRHFAPEFPAGDVRRWTKAVRRVTRRLGEARDLDVQILFVRDHLAHVEDPADRAGVERLLRRLERRRAKRQPQVAAAMDAFGASGLVADLGGVLRAALERAAPGGSGAGSAALHARAHEAAREGVARLFAFEPYVARPECAAELHAMRIAAKRLRYALELFAPAYDGALDRPIREVKRIQTLLGDLHDCDVWIETLPRFLARERRRDRKRPGTSAGADLLRPGIEHLRENRERRRAAVHGEFLEAWSRAGDADVWGGLLEAVGRPLAGAPPVAPDGGARP